MNEFAEFEAARPDDVALDAGTDARIRSTLGLTDAASSGDGAMLDVEHRHGEVSSVDDLAGASARRDESRRRWAMAASAAAVVLGVVGFAFVAGNRDARSTSDTPTPSPTLLSSADPEATSLVPRATDVGVSDTTGPDGSVTSQFEATDPLVEGLRIEVARAAEQIGWSFTGTEGIPGTPESPWATMIGANGDDRYIFEFRPIEPSTDCPIGDWASELVDSNDSGTPRPQGVLFVDAKNGVPTRASVVSPAGVISVRSLPGATGEPFDDAFSSVALSLADRIGYITNGGQRPEVAEVYCGDLLDDVARRYDTTNAALVELNDLADTNAIFAGMILELPQADASTDPRPVPDDVGQGSDMALLVTDPAPAGFVLDRARYMPETGGFGIARYLHPDHDTQFHVVIRSIPLPVERLEALGWEPFGVNGRDVWPDGETEGCLPDACSVGIQWDDDTYVSLMWVDPDGGNLVDGSTIDTLLDLVANLVERPDQWTELPQTADPSLPEYNVGRPGAVVVANANTVGGSGGALSTQLDHIGFDVGDPVNARTDATNPPLQDTIVYAAPGSECEAEQVAEVLGVASVIALPNPSPIDNAQMRESLQVLVLLGEDIATRLDGRFVPQPSTIDC